MALLAPAVAAAVAALAGILLWLRAWAARRTSAATQPTLRWHPRGAAFISKADDVEAGKPLLLAPPSSGAGTGASA